MADTKAAKAKKPGRIREYFRGVRTEMKKVIWPTKEETLKYTGVVVVVCAAFALLFWLLDTGFLFILEQVLKITM